MASRPKLLNPGKGFVAAYDWSISGLGLTAGCVLRCAYCYAPTIIHKSLEQFGQDGKVVKMGMEDWESLVEREAPKAAGKTVYMNVMTDPYQPHIRAHTRKLLEAMLRDPPAKLVLQTRSPHAAADAELMAQFGECLRVNFTIDTDNDEVRRDFSPTAPSIPARWKTLETIASAGVPACITCTPTLPFGRKKSDVIAWCERANALPTLTHVVVQEFHAGFTTKTSPEALERAKDYAWYFKEDGYKRLKTILEGNLRVPLLEGMPGFAPYAP